MARAFLVLGAAFGLVGVALGAFGAHALRAKLPPDRLTGFETGVRYQLWHALALFAVVLVGSLGGPSGGWFAYTPLTTARDVGLFPILAGWLFVAGVVLFSGSLYVLALTGNRRWGAVTPFGGIVLLAGWLSLLIAVVLL